MSHPFYTLDVFTTQKLAGNPLAVVLEAAGLTTEQMQGIAREFNLSETVFVFPPENPAHRAKLRIFTPGRELPFAGHPTVGAAILLARLDSEAGPAADRFVLEENVGPVPCEIDRSDAKAPRATFGLPRLPFRIDEALSVPELAQIFGLAEGDIGFPGHAPSVFSAGNGFSFVPVKGLAAMSRIKLDLANWDNAIKPADHPNAFVYCRETAETGHHYQARMVAPDMGVAEDPATGSAVAAFAGVVMAFDKPSDGHHSLVVEQGYEMGRPSQIALGLKVEGGKLASATIAGSAVLVSQGQLL
ncbi:MAG: PhzF family phenazine biosynthesis protein [Bosea sp. (in: a-proteobacteria)]